MDILIERNKKLKEYYSRLKIKVRKELYFQSEKGKEARKRYSQNNRIAMRLRSRIYQVLKGNTKSASTIELLGCNIKEFKFYFESLFLFGMTWENYGLWHIDHIKPCSKFDLNDPVQQRKCFHYTNLQPLWQKDNCKKSNK